MDKLYHQTQYIMVINNGLAKVDLLDENLVLNGFVTLITENKKEASDMLDAIHPDIVVLKTITADTHCLEILDMVKKNDDIPVMVITPDNQINTLKTMFDHGADSVLKKPFSKLILSARIHAILRRWDHCCEEANTRCPSLVS